MLYIYLFHKQELNDPLPLVVSGDPYTVSHDISDKRARLEVVIKVREPLQQTNRELHSTRRLDLKRLIEDIQ